MANSNTPAAWAFLQELFQRLFKKSPRFFNIISALSSIAIVLTGLPGIFEEVGITLPDSLTILQSKVVAWAAVVGLIIAKLTVVNSANLPLSDKK